MSATLHHPSSLSLLTVFILLHTVAAAAVSVGEGGFFTTSELSRQKLRQKITHFRVYWHDILSGSHPTAVPILKPLSFKKFGFFGMVTMIDNPLTVGPLLSSRVVGRAQGFYAAASQGELGFQMNMNFVFTDGKYNGSAIGILGRNAVAQKVREMAVVGGTGLFRFATGYALATTYFFDPKTGNAAVEYNVSVIHY